MRVCVKGKSSSSRPVLSGVPQGSVLGPILFLIYVNSIASDLKCDYKIFADDLKIFFFFTSNMYSLKAGQSVTRTHTYTEIITTRNNRRRPHRNRIRTGNRVSPGISPGAARPHKTPSKRIRFAHVFSLSASKRSTPPSGWRSVVVVVALRPLKRHRRRLPLPRGPLRRRLVPLQRQHPSQAVAMPSIYRLPR